MCSMCYAGAQALRRAHGGTAREGHAPGGCRGGCCRRAAPVLKIALHAYCRRLRRVKGRHLRRRQRQLRTHSAPRVKPWACLTPGAARAQWFLGGAGRLVISRDQVREQLRYHHNDFLGRANAHHLAVRHSGPSPSKGPARRAPRFLLEFSRRPFTGPRLARPCARDKQGQRQTRARWSGAPAASLSVS